MFSFLLPAQKSNFHSKIVRISTTNRGDRCEGRHAVPTNLTTYKRVLHIVYDLLEVGVAPGIFPCIFIPLLIVELLLLEGKRH